MNLKDQFGNMMLILFAGHDTTAHTMTWMTYELAKHPEHQARLHAEVDALFAALGGRDMVYEDCEKSVVVNCVTLCHCVIVLGDCHHRESAREQ